MRGPQFHLRAVDAADWAVWSASMTEGEILGAGAAVVGEHPDGGTVLDACRTRGLPGRVLSIGPQRYETLPARIRECLTRHRWAGEPMK